MTVATLRTAASRSRGAARVRLLSDVRLVILSCSTYRKLREDGGVVRALATAMAMVMSSSRSESGDGARGSIHGRWIRCLGVFNRAIGVHLYQLARPIPPSIANRTPEWTTMLTCTSWSPRPTQIDASMPHHIDYRPTRDSGSTGR